MWSDDHLFCCTSHISFPICNSPMASSPSTEGVKKQEQRENKNDRMTSEILERNRSTKKIQTQALKDQLGN